jgi:hypothetical protein
MPVGLSLMRTDTETVMVGFGFGTWEHGSNRRMPAEMETKVVRWKAFTREIQKKTVTVTIFKTNKN